MNLQSYQLLDGEAFTGFRCRYTHQGLFPFLEWSLYLAGRKGLGARHHGARKSWETTGLP